MIRRSTLRYAPETDDEHLTPKLSKRSEARRPYKSCNDFSGDVSERTLLGHAD